MVKAYYSVDEMIAAETRRPPVTLFYGLSSKQQGNGELRYRVALLILRLYSQPLCTWSLQLPDGA